jgi:hypothetical protein
MHQELRHQVKIHKISKKLKLGINVCIFLRLPFFLKKKMKKKHTSQ